MNQRYHYPECEDSEVTYCICSDLDEEVEASVNRRIDAEINESIEAYSLF